MRPIDADKLLETLKSFMDLPDPGYAMAIGRACFLVKDAPTISAPQWISVEDEKPDIGQYILVCHKDGIMQCARYIRSGYDDRDIWELDCYYEGQKEITHWMPLPEPPKKERNK